MEAPSTQRRRKERRKKRKTHARTETHQKEKGGPHRRVKRKKRARGRRKESFPCDGSTLASPAIEAAQWTGEPRRRVGARAQTSDRFVPAHLQQTHGRPRVKKEKRQRARERWTRENSKRPCARSARPTQRGKKCGRGRLWRAPGFSLSCGGGADTHPKKRNGVHMPLQQVGARTKHPALWHADSYYTKGKKIGNLNDRYNSDKPRSMHNPLAASHVCGALFSWVCKQGDPTCTAEKAHRGQMQRPAGPIASCRHEKAVDEKRTKGCLAHTKARKRRVCRRAPDWHLTTKGSATQEADCLPLAFSLIASTLASACRRHVLGARSLASAVAH
nr:hypothetical protein [Pandoravirus massiliensis]